MEIPEPDQKKQKVSTASSVIELIVYKLIDNKIVFSIAQQDDHLLEKNREKYFTKLSLEKEPVIQLHIKDSSPFLTPKILNSIRILHANEIELYLLEKQLNEKNPQSQNLSLSDWNEQNTLKSLKRIFLKIQGTLSPDANLAINKILLEIEEFSNEFSKPCKTPLSLPKKTKESLDFEKWLKDNGAQFSVSVSTIEGMEGYGVLADSNLKSGDVVLKIPKNLLINAESAKRSEIGYIFSEMSEIGYDDDTITLLFVMHQRFSEKSFFKNYLEILPESLSSPILFQFSELMELDGNPIFEEVIEVKEQLRVLSEGLFPQLLESYPDVFNEKILTFENLLWTRAIFDSRAFVLNINGKIQTTLVPLGDSLNHSPNGQIAYRRFDFDSQSFVMESFCEISKGEQVYFSYGSFSNRELFFHYGFLTDNNPLDVYPIRLEIQEDDELLDEKNAKLDQFGLKLDNFLTLNFISSNLIAAMRVCVADSSEWKENWDCFTILNAKNEKLALESIEQMIQALISGYPTVDGDSEEETEEKSFNTIIAIKYCEHSKKILEKSQEATKLLLEKIK